MDFNSNTFDLASVVLREFTIEILNNEDQLK